VESPAVTDVATEPRERAKREAFPEVLTVDEAAAFLRLDRKTVYRAITEETIPFRRLGRRIRLSRTALRAWLGAWDKGSSDGGSK